jgi:hypothetical protein
MMKLSFPVLFLIIASIHAVGQTKGQVDKKTKEFFVSATPKTEYRIFGYEYPNTSTRKMICFSSYTYDVSDNLNKCPLGSYFDSGRLKEGDRIIYFGNVGSFGKMNFISGRGTKTVFYIPKSDFVIK